MLDDSEEGTIISTIIKAKNFKVGLKFYKRVKSISDGRKIKGKMHEFRKVQNTWRD